MLPEFWRNKLSNSESVLLVGAHNPLSARIGASAGFDGIWWSSFEISTSYGLLDASLIWPDELAFMVQRACGHVTVPHVIDADAGYDGLGQLARATAHFKQAGASVICVEDQVHPKFNSLFPSSDRKLCSIEIMVERVKTIRKALGHDLGVFARVESFITGESVDQAIDRADAYAEAGADAIVIHSIKEDVRELADFSRRWTRGTPLVAIPTTYDSYGADYLANIGYRIVIYANVLIRTSIKAMYEAAVKLRKDETLSQLREHMLKIEEVKSLIDP